MATNGTPEQPEQTEARGAQPTGGLFGIPAKWLIIGGGAGGGMLLVVIVVVALFLFGVFGGGNPQPTSLLNLVPDDATDVFRMDVQRVLANDLLADSLDMETNSADFIADFEDTLGINRDDLSELAFVVGDNGWVGVLKGNFDLDYIRGELEDADSTDNPYRGYEVWENQSGGGAALLDEYIVISDNAVRPVENVLRNLYNGSGALAQAGENNEMKQILEKLGSGFAVFAGVGDVCQVKRCEGYGFVITEVDESAEEATTKIALLFRNERSAERAAADYDEVADFLERQEEIKIEDTEADGKFVVGVAIEDLAEQ